MINLRNIIFVLFLFYSSLMAKNDEFRATWVNTWHHITSGTIEQNQALVRKILDNHKKANMNAVLWQVRQGGTVYYPSAIEPWGKYANYQDPGYDHLAYAIEEAHKRGLELHAWFNVFQASDTSAGTPASVHPEWICRDGSGHPMPSRISLSPGLVAVREYTIDVAMEIVRNYDIDGLHLDYVRWNEYDNSDISKTLAKRTQVKQPIDGIISEERLQQLLKVNQVNRYLYDVEHPYSAGVPTGFATWEEWWRASVTEFVKVLHDSIQSVKPWVRLSPAALGRYNWGGWNGYNTVFQDAALWFNEGYVDQFMGMHYHWTTAQDFYDMLNGNHTEAWQWWIQNGISEGRLYSVGIGSFILEDLNIWNRHPGIVKKIRTVSWVDGVQFYNYGNWYGHRYWDEARESFFTKKTKIRAAKFILDAQPEQPSISFNAIDSLHYEVNVQPPESINESQRFAIYRSEDENLDVDEDEIVDIHFGQESYGFIDSLSGLQDFQGKYTYYATRFDRYWNESNISNSYTSDSIPSFAPQVMATVPVEGDTIAINSTISVLFSKTMNIDSVRAAISIDPSVAISTFTWSNGNKKLLITFQSNFEYSSDYTLTISKEASDVNGRLLDGDTDGTAGDDFTLNFRTKDVDDTGPRVVYSNPAREGTIADIDIEEVITIAFDELIDPRTVDDNSIMISDGLENLSLHTNIFTSYTNQSVIAVQPSNPFTPHQEYIVTLTDAITDTIGNQRDSTVSIYFISQSYSYREKMMIDNFSGSGAWERPDYSGTTDGVNPALSYFEHSGEVFLPHISKQRKSGKLHYVWDPVFLKTPDSEYILREYLNDSDPKLVTFDSSYTLQCYIFGDGSYNKIRFAVDDNVPEPLGANHEVSPWYTIDWIGWKLIRWDMEKDSTGSWLGDGHLEGILRFDSFQLTHEEGNANSGTLYFKDLRVVKKEYSTLGDIVDTEIRPISYHLSQNYPNPFNAQTKIDFSIVRPGKTSLVIYDILGRKVTELVNRYLEQGKYSFEFNATNLASGLYIYQLQSKGVFLRRKMMLVK